MNSFDMSGDIKHTLILGLGNPLMGDEGIGVRAIDEFEKLELSDKIAVHDGGTAGLGLIDLMAEYQRVIIIDAADMGHPPGDVIKFTPKDVRLKMAETILSPHQIGLAEMLALANALDMLPPELVVIGVQPLRIEAGAKLSPEMEEAIPQIIRIVLKELDAS